MKRGNAAAVARLQHDLEEIVQLQRTTGELAWLNIQPEHGDEEKWKMTLVGANGSYWSGQQYDFEIHFTKKFPFEPPSLYFPSTPLNARSIRHPAIGRNGELFLQSVSKDHWNCSWSMLNVIREVQALFTTNPLVQYTNIASLLLELPEAQLLTIASYLPLRSVLDMSQTCKKGLLLMHSNNLWAELYYSRCQVPAPILYVTGGSLAGAGPGPLREISQRGGQREWRHAREAFIRAYQCHQEVSRYGVPRTECLAANELAVLLPLVFPAEHLAAVSAATEAYDTSGASDIAQDAPAAPMPTPPQNNVFLSLQHALGSAVPRSMDAEFLAALRYRCLRAARLARSLGGEECLRANIEHNYWGNIPVTTLIFLASLVQELGPRGDRRGWLESQLLTIVAQHQHVAQSGIRRRGVAGETVGPQLFQGPSESPGGDAGMAVEGVAVEGGPPADPPCPLVQLKLQLVQQLLDSQGARGAAGEAENCSNFERNAYSQKGDLNAAQDAIRPDLYDLLEVLHETNIALSFAFRDTPETIWLDCLDQNGDWLVATPHPKQAAIALLPPAPAAPVAAAAAAAVPAVLPVLSPFPQNLFQLDARPDEACRRQQAEYIAAVTRGASATAELGKLWTGEGSSSGWRCCIPSDPSGGVARSRGDAQWLCVFCLSTNAFAGTVCRRCRNASRIRLPLDDMPFPHDDFPALRLDIIAGAAAESHPTQPPGTEEHEPSAKQAENARSLRAAIERVTLRLARAVSPFLAFSGKKAGIYFGKFCVTLQEEQKVERQLAASYYMLQNALRRTEKPDQAESSSGDEPAAGLLSALKQRLMIVRDRFPDFSPTSAATRDCAVPITSARSSSQANATDLSQLSPHYMMDLTNSAIRHQGLHSHAWPADIDSLLTTRLYEPLSFARSLYAFSTVTVHFVGFDARFDERIEVCSARLAPYRTHTARPATAHTQALAELLLRAQDQVSGVHTARHTQGLASAAHPFDLPAAAASTSEAVCAHRRREEVFRPAHYKERHPKKPIAIVAPPELSRTTAGEARAGKKQKVEYVEFFVRCLWLMSRPGGGVVRYRVPSTTSLGVVVQDYCAVQGVSAAQVRAARLDMARCLRHVFERRTTGSWDGASGQVSTLPGVNLLNTLSTIAELQISQHNLIDLIYYY